MAENRFKKAQETRKKEQTAIKEKLTNDATNNFDNKQVTLMIYISKKLKRDLKIYALNHDKPVAVLLRQWIEEKLYTNEKSPD